MHQEEPVERNREYRRLPTHGRLTSPGRRVPSSKGPATSRSYIRAEASRRLLRGTYPEKHRPCITAYEATADYAGTSIVFGMPDGAAFVFSDAKRKEWEKHGDILGRNLLENTFAQPPTKATHYFIGEYKESTTTACVLAALEGMLPVKLPSPHLPLAPRCQRPPKLYSKLRELR